MDREYQMDEYERIEHIIHKLRRDGRTTAADVAMNAWESAMLLGSTPDEVYAEVMEALQKLREEASAAASIITAAHSASTAGKPQVNGEPEMTCTDKSEEGDRSTGNCMVVDGDEQMEAITDREPDKYNASERRSNVAKSRSFKTRSGLEKIHAQDRQAGWMFKTQARKTRDLVRENKELRVRALLKERIVTQRKKRTELLKLELEAARMVEELELAEKNPEVEEGTEQMLETELQSLSI